jgi:RNA polymerase sigma factor (TIGR02999 family)
MSSHTATDHRVTALLVEARHGRREALDALVPLVYDALRRMARQQLSRERPGHTLQPTALAHEAYARLVGLERIEWRDRAHFFAAVSGAMRRVLVDHAVARKARKRGGGAVAVTIETGMLAADDRLDDVLVVDEALARLEREHPSGARIVECRIFAGMTVDETATALGISPATVKRHWEVARAWLIRDLGSTRRR